MNIAHNEEREGMMIKTEKTFREWESKCKTQLNSLPLEFANVCLLQYERKKCKEVDYFFSASSPPALHYIFL